MIAPSKQEQGSGVAAPTPRVFDIPTNPDNLDAGLWKLVGCFKAINQQRMELHTIIDMHRARGENDKAVALERGLCADYSDTAGDIEMAIYATPARTPAGFMIKLELAMYWAYGSDRYLGEPALPPLSVEPGYFTIVSRDGGVGFDRRTLTAAWQDAVRLFGLPPLLDPDWRNEP